MSFNKTSIHATARRTSAVLRNAASAACALAALAAFQPAPAPAAPKPDAAMKRVLDTLGTLGGKPIPTLTPEEARRQPTPTDAVMALLKADGRSTEPVPVGKVVDTTIPSPAGDIPVRVYTPAKGDGPIPVIVYFHGGGWVIATIDTYDASARALANGAGAVVVSVEYRKGPEAPFPAAHEDSFAAYKWTLENAESLGGDPARVAVAGESAGGNLANAVSAMARDKGVTVPLHQLLVYPVTAAPSDNASYKANADAKPLDKPMMEWFVKHASSDPARDGANPYFAPLTHGDAKGLPPTTIITAEIDPLRTEGMDYARKLKDAGVKVKSKDYEGVSHEFFGMAAVVPDAKKAQDFAAGELKAAFAKKR